MSTIIVQSSPLLRLPAELRNSIFCELVQGIDTVVYYNFGPHTHSIVRHPLARTCRQLRGEFSLFYEYEAQARAHYLRINCHIHEIFNTPAALARLNLGGWPDIKILLQVDHDTFNRYGSMLRSLIWDEHPNSNHKFDILDFLKIKLHDDVTLDEIETALEDFNLERPYYVSQGFDAARANGRWWTKIYAPLRDAVYERGGHFLLQGKEYRMRKKARNAKKTRALKVIGEICA